MALDAFKAWAFRARTLRPLTRILYAQIIHRMVFWVQPATAQTHEDTGHAIMQLDVIQSANVLLATTTTSFSTNAARATLLHDAGRVIFLVDVEQ